jgi:hypothetical protein
MLVCTVSGLQRGPGAILSMRKTVVYNILLFTILFSNENLYIRLSNLVSRNSKGLRVALGVSF